MNDEIITAEQPAAGVPAVNPHLLAYDFFKHMTNLSIITLGGMVTLFGSVFADVHSKGEMLVPMTLTRRVMGESWHACDAGGYFVRRSRVGESCHAVRARAGGPPVVLT